MSGKKKKKKKKKTPEELFEDYLEEEYQNVIKDSEEYFKQKKKKYSWYGMKFELDESEEEERTKSKLSGSEIAAIVVWSFVGLIFLFTIIVSLLK